MYLVLGGFGSRFFDLLGSGWGVSGLLVLRWIWWHGIVFRGFWVCVWGLL